MKIIFFVVAAALCTGVSSVGFADADPALTKKLDALTSAAKELIKSQQPWHDAVEAHKKADAALDQAEQAWKDAKTKLKKDKAAHDGMISNLKKINSKGGGRVTDPTIDQKIQDE